jgi:transposase
MTRANSRSESGTRAYCKHSGRRSSNISLVGAIRLGQKPILYPFDGAVDGERFVFYLKEKVVPTLTRGDVIIMDNCRIHYVKEILQMLNPIGINTLYLPPYSPELNPIEETWSTVKYDFKSTEPRTIFEYIDSLNKAKELITLEKIVGFFNHAKSFLKHAFHMSHATG